MRKYDVLACSSNLEWNCQSEKTVNFCEFEPHFAHPFHIRWILIYNLRYITDPAKSKTDSWANVYPDGRMESQFRITSPQTYKEFSRCILNNHSMFGKGRVSNNSMISLIPTLGGSKRSSGCSSSDVEKRMLSLWAARWNDTYPWYLWIINVDQLHLI